MQSLLVCRKKNWESGLVLYMDGKDIPQSSDEIKITGHDSQQKKMLLGETFELVEVMPEYPGVQVSLATLSVTLRSPADALKEKIEGEGDCPVCHPGRDRFSNQYGNSSVGISLGRCRGSAGNRIDAEMEGRKAERTGGECKIYPSCDIFSSECRKEAGDDFGKYH